MAGKKTLVVILLLMFFGGVAAICLGGDRGGKLLPFSYYCVGAGAMEVYCSDGSSRGQCFERTSCDPGDCNVSYRGKHKTGCKAECDSGSTSIEIFCSPLPLTNPLVTLTLDEYEGLSGQPFYIEGFAADAQFINDLYFEDVEGCDLNQVKTGMGNVSASVKAEFRCPEPFSKREIKLVAKDECKAISDDNALLSVVKYCPNECSPRLYPQCRQGSLFECRQEGECTFIDESVCEHGCGEKEGECCQPIGCIELGFECGQTTGYCDENISCGECADGNCLENKCVVEQQPEQPANADQQASPFPFEINPVFIAVAVIAIIAVVVIYLKSRD